MFEGLVHQLLSGYLGRYIKDFQNKQFEIGLWNGDVVLKNLELILDSFDYLELPVAITKGTIGKLSITIPWKKLGWDPIIVVLQDVYLCTSPRGDSEWSSQKIEAREYAGKKAKLAAAELAKLSRRVCDNQAGQSFISYISAKILENIQVSVHDLYFDYVDPNAQFIVGLQFETLMVTADVKSKQNNNGHGSKVKSGHVHKVIELTKFSLSWSPLKDGSHVAANNSLDKVHLPDKEHDPEECDYIVAPFDASVSLMVNKFGQYEKGAPHYSAALNLTCLVVSFNEVQLHQMLFLADSLTIGGLRQRYGRYRPWDSPLSKKLHGWQKAWWQYAQNSVLFDVHMRLKRMSWSTLGLRM